jgi:hypothetical protein
MATSLPITCAQTMVIASHWVGLTLPGMIELPGSFSGIRSSPSPQRGPAGQPAHVVGDLHQRHRQLLERAVRERPGVVRRQRRERLGAATKGQAGVAREHRRHPLAELRVGVEPGADRRAAHRELAAAAAAWRSMAGRASWPPSPS